MSRQYAFYFDQSRCMACNSCSVGCKDWNQLNPGLVNWRTQFTYETESTFSPFSMACNHCTEPSCIPACTVNAISKDDNGIVTVDRTKCVSIRACITACPFASPKIAEDKQEPVSLNQWKARHPMQKCTFCIDRIERNDSPACVKACVARAMDFGTVEDLMLRHPEAVRLNSADFPYAFKNNTTDTQPNFFIKKKSGAVIRKSDIYQG